MRVTKGLSSSICPARGLLRHAELQPPRLDRRREAWMSRGDVLARHYVANPGRTSFDTYMTLERTDAPA